MERRTADEFDQELLNLYDKYVHGDIDRRGFRERAAKFAVGGMTAAPLLDASRGDGAVLRHPTRGRRRHEDQGAAPIHYAENDDRVNSGWPAYEAALKASNVPYTAYTYPGTQHGFNNDTTPRYDRTAATLAWQRTIDFLNRSLRAA